MNSKSAKANNILCEEKSKGGHYCLRFKNHKGKHFDGVFTRW